MLRDTATLSLNQIGLLSLRPPLGIHVNVYIRPGDTSILRSEESKLSSTVWGVPPFVGSDTSMEIVREAAGAECEDRVGEEVKGVDVKGRGDNYRTAYQTLTPHLTEKE